jgi:outer membrane protein TolC
MTAKHLLYLFLIFVVASPATLIAQRPPSAPENEAPLLTLDDAVSVALSNNRLVKNSALEVQKLDFRVNTARSRRLPQLQLNALGGELLHSFDFTFDQGVFGTYPTIGPVPGTKTKIRNPARFSTYVTGNADQPLTQQYKIGLGIRATRLEQEIAREDVRAERQKIAAEVRKAYFDLVAIQAGVEATREAVATLEEAQRVTARYRLQETVLRADELEVDARLAKSRFELSVAENGLDTQRERLNQLLGRDLNTPFRVESFPEEDTSGLTLEDARRQATQNRPEVREAQLKTKQAEVDRRLAKAEYIPDLSLSLRYQGISNVRVLPANVTTAGFYLNWEPFDWGRKKCRRGKNEDS